jgi:hypothetical protein
MTDIHAPLKAKVIRYRGYLEAYTDVLGKHFGETHFMNIIDNNPKKANWIWQLRETYQDLCNRLVEQMYPEYHEAHLAICKEFNTPLMHGDPTLEPKISVDNGI